MSAQSWGVTCREPTSNEYLEDGVQIIERHAQCLVESHRQTTWGWGKTYTTTVVITFTFSAGSRQFAIYKLNTAGCK